ncbi:serine hydrolase domain-containing protein [Yinghuangia aomiensis]
MAHVLAERGALDYDTPIVEFWPEFGAHGKDKATVRHALTHSLGVPAVPADLTVWDLADWDRMCALIAAAEPWWEPGTKTGYHAVTWGFVMGEIVRRATGKPIAAGARRGGGEAAGHRRRTVLRRTGIRNGPARPARGRAWGRRDDGGDARRPPAGQGHAARAHPQRRLRQQPGRADLGHPLGRHDVRPRAVARMYAALLGEVDGVRLISDARLRTATALATTEVDQMVGFPAPRALGYNLGRPGADPQRTLSVFGMPGMGGSTAYADTETGVAFALTKNRFFPGPSDAVDRIGALVAEAVAD